ncbi:LysR family transcriptional regulator [Inhella sp. 1Y17]|uniref:LysR family transcriptional regulator n=2 Tax=Inhella proteolytica TaxID=2795029 RepID=A0A931J023_9BURK|nr:LysR family transcriptional regulator [Inhella proteolytica]
MDKFSAMRAFVRVVEAGSFTRAAEALGVPKAQVTRQVQALEQELRTLLLNRTTRRVTATAEGAAYYERAVSVLDDVEELESSLSHAKAHPRGRLRVDVPSPAATLVLLPALHEFCAQYPDIQIDLGISDRVVDLVAERVDCAIRGGTITDPSLIARRLGEIRRVACASPEYLRRHGMPQHPSDLEDETHRVISYFAHGSERLTYVMERGKERVEVHPKSGIAVNDSSAMLAAGLAGLGIARTGAFMAAPYVAAGSLQIVLPEWSAGVSPLYLVYPPNRHVPARLRVFIDWVVKLFDCALSGQTRGPATGLPNVHKELAL